VQRVRGVVGLNAGAIRFTNVYGPGMGAKDTFIVRLLRAAAAKRPVTVYGDGLQERDYVYIDDAVSAMFCAEEQHLTGPLTVGTGVSTSVLEVCQLAADHIGIPVAMTHVEAPRGEMRAVRVDISKARALGYQPSVALPQGLERTWKALHAEPEFLRSTNTR
jgi:UDP-glucose 4-epimerase